MMAMLPIRSTPMKRDGESPVTKKPATTSTIRRVRLMAGAKYPFIYVLKQELKVTQTGTKPSRFKIAAHKILMRDEDYAQVENYLAYIEEVNRNLEIPRKYEIWKESMAFGDGDYE